ncbi:MAG: hypothetical protein WCT18_03875 [Patescibacteria group bacterium]
MKKFERPPESPREKTQKTLENLVAKCSPTQIEFAKNIFWESTREAGGKEKYQKLEPQVCAAIDDLPKTNKFRLINEIYLEICVDILKMAMEE